MEPQPKVIQTTCNNENLEMLLGMCIAGILPLSVAEVLGLDVMLEQDDGQMFNLEDE